MAYTDTNGQQFVIIIISPVLLINAHCRHLTLMYDKPSHMHFLYVYAPSSLQCIAARKLIRAQHNAVSRRLIQLHIHIRRIGLVQINVSDDQYDNLTGGFASHHPEFDNVVSFTSASSSNS